MLSNTFLQNSATNGGAVWQNNLRRANHTLNLFVGNDGPKGSGGIEMNQITSMNIDNCNFTLGTGSKGGALYTQVSILNSVGTDIPSADRPSEPVSDTKQSHCRGFQAHVWIDM